MKLDRKKQITVIAVLGTCLLIAAFYLGGLLYYGSHFLPKTYVNETDVSGMNVADANEKLSALDPSVTVIEKTDDPSRPLEEKIFLRKMNTDISYDTSSLLKSQNSVLWFTSLFARKDLNCSLFRGTYDPQKADGLCEGLFCMNEENITMPEDATVKIENGEAVIVEAKEGTWIDAETVNKKIKETIENCFSGEGENTVDLTPFYAVPKGSKELQLSSLKEDLQKALDKTVHLIIDPSQEEDLEGTELAELLDVEENVITVDEEKLKSYVSALCSEYDVSSREYIDRTSLKNDLEEALVSAQDQTVNVNWIHEQARGLIEVVISEQMLYYYENDWLVMTSPIVSGNPDITEETIHGRFTVKRMSRDAQLMGRDYLEHVDYWIGFDETGRVYGFHDASWRDSFGGDIWLTDPSRGCVNMPTDKVAQLYDYVDIGTEVYIHD